MVAHLAEGDAEVAAELTQAAVNQNDGTQLREHGSHGSANYPNVQEFDKQDIQKDVQAAGDGQDPERGVRVADGPEDAGADIIDHGEQQAGQIDAQIAEGGIKDCGLRPCGLKHQGGAENTQNGHGHTKEHRKSIGDADGAQELVPVMQTEGVGDHHRGANGHSVEKTDHQIGRTHTDTDSGQSFFPDKFAHHQGVHAVV